MNEQLITLEPDMSIEPGHQLIVVPNDREGFALATLLTGMFDVRLYLQANGGSVDDWNLRIPHDYVVDQNIVKLIDQLAHVRFSAPDLVQLSLTENRGVDHDLAMDAMHEMDAWKAIAEQGDAG